MPVAPSAQQFKVDVLAMIQAAKGRLRAAAIEGIQDVAEQIITTSPVLTGTLRGSWHMTIGGAGGEAPVGSPDPSGASAVAEVALVVAGMNLGDTLYLRNGTAYAMRLEYGFVGQDSLGRTYNQQGKGWVRAAVSEAPAIFAAAAARVAAGQLGGAHPGGGGALPGKGIVRP